MRYAYTAYNVERGVFHDAIEAPDAQEAAKAVASLGNRVLKMGPVRSRPGPEVLFPSLFKTGPKDLVHFCRQVTAMLTSGGTLTRALEMAESQTRSRMMRSVIRQLSSDLSSGESLSTAMKSHPKVFDQLFLSVVEVGEHTGRLAVSLEQIADAMEADIEAKARAVKALMYPMAIMGMSLVTLGVLITVAVPPLLNVFDQLGADAPAMTKAAVAMVNFVKGNGMTVFLTIFGALTLIAVLRRQPRLAAGVDAVLARTPLYGPLTVAGDLARFARTNALLLEAGVPLSDGLALSIPGCANVQVRAAMEAGERSLLAGSGFAPELRGHSVLPSLFREMMSMGEEGNQLPRMMRDAAVAYQKEREARLGALIGALEPVSTVVVGGIVAFIAFSMFVPIYSGLDKLG
jgi:type II secretory pathway component PulF